MSVESRALLRDAERLKGTLVRWAVYQFLAFAALVTVLAWLS